MNRAMKRVGIGEGRERGKSGDKESRVEDQENAWLKWQGYIGKKSWRKGNEVPGLERFSVGGGVRRAERSQGSCDTVGGPRGQADACPESFCDLTV